jgi:hypothetical protein
VERLTDEPPLTVASTYPNPFQMEVPSLTVMPFFSSVVPAVDTMRFDPMVPVLGIWKASTKVPPLYNPYQVPLE